jgi:hypothetical protein
VIGNVGKDAGGELQYDGIDDRYMPGDISGHGLKIID